MCKTHKKPIKPDKSGNTVMYPKAGKPQAGATLAASTYPQLNVSSDTRIVSRAAWLGGQSPCLCARHSGHGICWVAKASQSGHFTGQHPKSTAVPRVSAALPCSWGTAAYSHVMQQVALFWDSFAGVHICMGSSCTSPFPSLYPIPRISPMQISHRSCSSRLSSKCFLG